MRKRRLELGIMGGTFNPIHQGHLAAAESVRDEFKLDEIVFVPSGIPPHKNNGEIIAPEHRWVMTLLGISTNDHFSASSVELDRGGESYTKDTILHLGGIYGDTGNLCFITGADAIAEISMWHETDALAGQATFIAASRPGYRLEIDRIDKRFQGCTRLVEVPALAISSTDIRERVKAGKSIKYLVPDMVEEYIVAHGLYRE